MKWVEHPYDDGTPGAVERWTAILTVIVQTPRTEMQLRKNPLGVFIDGIAWSRDLGGTP